MAALDAEIGAHLKPYEEALTLIQTIPGVSDVTASALIAEVGVDMDQFPTADHLASWAGIAAAWAATKCRAYTVQTNGGNGYQVDAAAAKFAKIVPVYWNDSVEDVRRIISSGSTIIELD
ncbi:transposase [Paenibacillus puerhi]|uniref:transposase n=1 Tax=Paenibacillus puerhi TaxID=2692622 RepID=UPI0022A77CB1|nr:transposase [Paenibacillus puerhi]